ALLSSPDHLTFLADRSFPNLNDIRFDILYAPDNSEFHHCVCGAALAPCLEGILSKRQKCLSTTGMGHRTSGTAVHRRKHDARLISADQASCVQCNDRVSLVAIRARAEKRFQSLLGQPKENH